MGSQWFLHFIVVEIELYEVKNEERKGNNMAKSFLDLCNKQKYFLAPSSSQETLSFQLLTLVWKTLGFPKKLELPPKS